MEAKPGYLIAVYRGDPQPVVLSTATTVREQRQLDSWLSECPALRKLVDAAALLADDELEGPDVSGAMT